MIPRCGPHGHCEWALPFPPKPDNLSSMQTITTPIKALSWNMQAGMGTRKFRDYALRVHENILPAGKAVRLAHASRQLAEFDLVGIQECDLGSWRSGNAHQGRLLAAKAFTHHAFHTSRRISKVAGSGLALLSKYPLVDAMGHILPSRLPGRGALSARVETPRGTLRVLVVHFSLGFKDQARQWGWVRDWVDRSALPSLVMGDFNVGPGCPMFDSLVSDWDKESIYQPPATFPSWKPTRALDHILTMGLRAGPPEIFDPGVSDHLGMARKIWLPGDS